MQISENDNTKNLWNKDTTTLEENNSKENISLDENNSKENTSLEENKNKENTPENINENKDVIREKVSLNYYKSNNKYSLGFIKRGFHTSSKLKNNNTNIEKNPSILSYLNDIEKIIKDNNDVYEVQRKIETSWIELMKEKLEDPKHMWGKLASIIKKVLITLKNMKILECLKKDLKHIIKNLVIIKLKYYFYQFQWLLLITLHKVLLIYLYI
jgi:hypothetical protein